MSARSVRIDALRGIAVFGILLVNVWSFVYGNEMPRFGVFNAASGTADHLAVFFVSAFAEQKFYPIFAFLFGAGFALQTGAARPPGAELDAIRARYGRRIQWLLACGLLHGSLIWYGDILTVYALTALWLAPKAGRRLRQLKESLHGVLLVNVGVQVVGFFFIVMYSLASAEELRHELDAGREAFLTYTQGSWLEVARLRVADYSYNLVGGFLFYPRVALLFIAGVFAVRLGWLTRPERHRLFWRRVLVIGLGLGLPLNLWWGYVSLRMSIDPHAPARWSGLAMYLADLAGPCLAAGYIALLMRARKPVMAILARFFAPAGRMALTNYLSQSVILGLLLQGFGLGLGAVLSHGQLLALCFVLIGLQIALSRWWLAGHAQGPVEALWRRYSNAPP